MRTDPATKPGAQSQGTTTPAGGEADMSGIGRVPAWWLTLTGISASAALELLRAVERRGVSKNDRREVERIWHALRIDQAIEKTLGGAP
jgi:hypothetical protein